MHFANPSARNLGNRQKRIPRLFTKLADEIDKC